MFVSKLVISNFTSVLYFHTINLLFSYPLKTSDTAFILVLIIPIIVNPLMYLWEYATANMDWRSTSGDLKYYF